MTLLFCDSFDHYTTPTDKWSDVSVNGSGFSGTIDSSGGRFTNGFRFNCVNGGNYVANKDLASSDDQFVVGTAFRVSGVGWERVAANMAIAIRENTTYHIELRTDSSGRLYVTRAGTTILGPGSTNLVIGTWYYIEIKGTIHESAGTVTVRINGVQELTGSSLDTRNGGSGIFDRLTLGGGVGLSAGMVLCYDDLYVCDANGSTNNDFLGDVRVEAIFPSGNGNSSQLVGSDGNSTDNYLLVDETTPSDSDYVESSTVSEKDTYAYGNVTPTAGTVYGLQVMTRAAKTDAGTRSVASIARLSGSEVDSADKTLSTTYTYYPDIRETKPGGGAWSISDVNSAEFGVKVTA